MRTRSFPLAAAAVLLGGATLVQAADGPHDDAIESRQGLMSLYSWNLGTLSAMAKEKMPYDAERASIAATDLDALARLHQDGLWPEGSDESTEGNRENRALPAIWEDYADFTEGFDDLAEASAAMKTAAGGGLDSLKGAMNDVGGACKGCHDDYRAEKK